MKPGFLKLLKKILTRQWQTIRAMAEKGRLKDFARDRKIMKAIHDAINSPTKTYRYVLPTQLLAKAADPRLDSRCIQASRGGVGSFDARTVAHKVIVPFDQATHDVLGGSAEPYVNNPLRVPEDSEPYRRAQKNTDDWDKLCFILGKLESENNPVFSLSVLKQILAEIYRRLSLVHVRYPAPKRVSLAKCLAIIKGFLSEHSGGDRLLALTSSLFLVTGRHFRLYSDVKRAKTTASDKATGMVADLECLSERGDIVLAVEVKDRELTIGHIKMKIPNIREKRVSEVFFIAQSVARSDSTGIRSLAEKEFISGHNIYVTDLLSLARQLLALLGEEGRRQFLVEVGAQLDQYQSDIVHRRTWARMLERA